MENKLITTKTLEDLLYEVKMALDGYSNGTHGLVSVVSQLAYCFDNGEYQNMVRKMNDLTEAVYTIEKFYGEHPVSLQESLNSVGLPNPHHLLADELDQICKNKAG